MGQNLSQDQKYNNIIEKNVKTIQKNNYNNFYCENICNSQWTFCGYPNFLSPLSKSLIPTIAPSNQLINQPIGMEKAKAFAQ